MPRPPRHQAPGAYYHVATRGNNKQPIFDDTLRTLFLENLFRVTRLHEWRVIAYALMLNHYHLVLQIGNLGLSNGMFELNNGFARASNSRFGRINHCFGQRYWSAHLDTDYYVLNSIRYCHWNPARAGVCSDPSGSSWTSFRASVGLDTPHPALALGDLLGLFHADPVLARRALAGFVSEGRDRCQAPWDGPRSR